MTEVCDKCGVAYGIGDWYLCPHGRGTLDAIEDSIPGGFWQTNFGDKPEYFESKKAMLARADELNLRPRDWWAGPDDQHLTNWSAVSAKSLEDAKAMLERVGTARSDERRATLDTVHFTVKKYES